MRFDRTPEMMAVIKAANGVNKLARGLGVSPQTASEWVSVPERHLDKAADLTGIPKHRIRPDLYRPIEGGAA